MNSFFLLSSRPMRPLQALKRQWAGPSAPEAGTCEGWFARRFLERKRPRGMGLPRGKNFSQHRCRGDRPLPKAWSKRSLGKVPKRKRRECQQRKTTPLIQQIPALLPPSSRSPPFELPWHTPRFSTPLRGDWRGGIALWMHQPNAYGFSGWGTKRKPVRVRKGLTTVACNLRLS